MVCSQLLKMGGAQNSLPHPSFIILIIIMMMTMNRMTKKAALGGPSSDETFPLREKTKSYVLLLAAATYPT